MLYISCTLLSHCFSQSLFFFFLCKFSQCHWTLFYFSIFLSNTIPISLPWQIVSFSHQNDRHLTFSYVLLVFTRKPSTATNQSKSHVRSTNLRQRCEPPLYFFSQLNVNISTPLCIIHPWIYQSRQRPHRPVTLTVCTSSLFDLGARCMLKSCFQSFYP